MRDDRERLLDIGEAARNLSDALRDRHPDVPWSQIIAMRNTLVHDYFGVDVEEIWSTVEKDLPALKRQVETILEELQISRSIGDPAVRSEGDKA